LFVFLFSWFFKNIYPPYFRPALFFPNLHFFFSFFFSFFIFLFSSCYWMFFFLATFLNFTSSCVFFFNHFFPLFFSICANVFSFILLIFFWFCNRHWMNNSEQVHASLERKVYFINF
jgi:hypothetical protein